MASAQDGTKELRILVGILVAIMFAVVLTAWTNASAQPRTRAVAPSPDPDVVHADLYFDSNSVRLRADAAKVLQEKATRMDAGSAWVVLVQGYADRNGAPEYNRGLAQRRAEIVKQFLVELGVPEASIKALAIGQDGSLCEGVSRECQQLNRRVHIEIRKLPPTAVVPIQSAVMDKDSVVAPASGR